jgi:hypothetical protein
MSDSNSIRVNERTSLNVYEADIFICSRQGFSISPVTLALQKHSCNQGKSKARKDVRQ